MKTLKTRKEFAVFLVIVLSFLKISFAQNPDSSIILFLGPKVGSTIDLQEKLAYGVLKYISTTSFDSAQFLKLPDNRTILRIWTNDGKMLDRPSTNNQYLYTRRIIDETSYENKVIVENPEEESDSIFIITLMTGNVYTGRIVERRKDEIEVETETVGKITIQLSEIKKIKGDKASYFRDGKYWFPNPHPTRYLFGPSAYCLKKREAYYQNTFVILHSFNIGITDNISIGGGLEGITVLASILYGGGPIFFITPKIGFNVKDKLNVGGGILYANLLGINNGIIYGVVTKGSKEHNVTAGIGWGFIEDEFSGRPIVTFSGMTRIGRTCALVTENWFVPYKREEYDYYSYSPSSYYVNAYAGAISGGIRILGEKVSLDVAVVTIAADNTFLPLPYVDVVFKL